MTVTAAWRERMTRAYAAALLAHPDATRPQDTLACAIEATLSDSLAASQRVLVLAAERARVARTDAAARALPTSAALTPPTSFPAPEADPTSLTVSALDALPAESWLRCARWLFEGEGYEIEEPNEHADTETAVRWPLRHGEHAAMALVERLPAGWLLDERAVERAAALVAGAQDTDVVLFTTAEATVSALLAARRLHVNLWARTEVANLLAHRATAFDRERARGREALAARAAAATRARMTVLTALDTLVQASDARAANGYAAGRSAIATAADTVAPSVRALEQCWLAWETLLRDWTEAFAERPGPDGALGIRADETAFDAIAARATHLCQISEKALDRLADAPGSGELGYTTWHQALADEINWRWQALRWRLLCLDPSHWEDHTGAHDAAAESHALRASSSADHAHTRARTAYTQLAARAALDPPDAAG